VVGITFIDRAAIDGIVYGDAEPRTCKDRTLGTELTYCSCFIRLHELKLFE
jgi:hypothetical protein